MQETFTAANLERAYGGALTLLQPRSLQRLAGAPDDAGAEPLVMHSGMTP